VLYTFKKLSHILSPTVLDPGTKNMVLEMKQLFFFPDSLILGYTELLPLMS
jgi:hypothetical protein